MVFDFALFSPLSPSQNCTNIPQSTRLERPWHGPRHLYLLWIRLSLVPSPPRSFSVSSFSIACTRVQVCPTLALESRACTRVTQCYRLRISLRAGHYDRHSVYPISTGPFAALFNVASFALDLHRVRAKRPRLFVTSTFIPLGHSAKHGDII